MIIEKTFLISIDTNNTSLLYATDYQASLEAELTSRYCGKCYKSSYVLEITKLLRWTPPILDFHRPTGSAKIDVEFAARCLVYERDEVIPAAAIVQILETAMILKTDHAVIMMMADPKIQHYKVGEMVPVRVAQVKYTPSYTSIQVSAIPFTPFVEPLEQRITPTSKLNSTLTQKIADAQKRLSELDSKSVKAYTKGVWDLHTLPKDATRGWQLKPLNELEGLNGIVKYYYDPDTTRDISCWFKPDDGPYEKNTETFLVEFQSEIWKDLELTISLIENYYTNDAHKPDTWIKVYSIKSNSG